MAETSTTRQLVFRRGDATADELQDVLDLLLEDLARADTDVARAARTAGVDPALAAGAQVVVREREQGAEPLATTMLVAITVHAGSQVVDTLWKEVMWPRLRRRLGAASLGEPDDAPTTPADDVTKARD